MPAPVIMLFYILQKAKMSLRKFVYFWRYIAAQKLRRLHLVASTSEACTAAMSYYSWQVINNNSKLDISDGMTPISTSVKIHQFVSRILREEYVRTLWYLKPIHSYKVSVIINIAALYVGSTDVSVQSCNLILLF